MHIHSHNEDRINLKSKTYAQDNRQRSAVIMLTLSQK